MAGPSQRAAWAARDMRYRMAQQEKQAAADQIRQGLYRAYRKAIEDAIANAREIAATAQVEESKYRQALFQRVGELAQRSVLSSYDQLVTRREGPASHTHYRQGQGRLSGGILRRALASSAFFTATADGIAFGNVDELDAAAAHWHRINFGASPRGEGTDAEYPVNFGSSATALGIEEGPSPGFSMPAGIWLNTGGNIVRPGSSPRGADLFFPGKLVGGTPAAQLNGTIRRSQIRSTPAALRNTAGMEGKNFLNAGVRRLAEEIPKAYTQYTQDLLDGIITKVSAKRQRSEIIQGPTHFTSRSSSSLTQGVEGGTGYGVELP